MSHITPHQKKKFPSRPPKHSLILKTSFRNDIFSDSFALLDLWRGNVKYVTYVRGYTITQIFDEVRKQGLKISRNAFVSGKYKGKRVLPSFLYFVTFANVLNVPLWLLFSLDIESDCKRLGLF